MSKETHKFQFKEIVSETNKSWQLRMMGDILSWYPKSVCYIDKNHIVLPDRLMNKILIQRAMKAISNREQ